MPSDFEPCPLCGDESITARVLKVEGLHAESGHGHCGNCGLFAPLSAAGQDGKTVREGWNRWARAMRAMLGAEKDERLDSEKGKSFLFGQAAGRADAYNTAKERALTEAGAYWTGDKLAQAEALKAFAKYLAAENSKEITRVDKLRKEQKT